MVALFDYLSRSDIYSIQCIAHKLHQVICNGLKIWTKRATAAQEADSPDDDIDEHLSQTVRTIHINEDLQGREDHPDGDQAREVNINFSYDCGTTIIGLSVHVYYPLSG